MTDSFRFSDDNAPFSLEAEQSVLGSALQDSSCVPELIHFLRPEYFYRPQHRQLFEIIMAKFSLGEAIDVVTVLEAAFKEEVFSSKNDAQVYLVELAQSVPSTHNIEAYASILKAKYYLRQLIESSQRIIEEASTPSADADVLLDSAEQSIYSIRHGTENNDLKPAKEVVIDTFDRLQKLSGENRNDYLGIPTGYSDLDRTITGLNKSDLIVIAARPGMGKTAFALNIAANIALHKNKTVAIFSLEMSKDQLMNRLFAAEGNIDSKRLMNGELTQQDWAVVANLAPLFSNSQIYMDDSAGITVPEIKAKVRRLHKVDLIVIDYLQLMGSGRRTDNRVQEISDITRTLKVMAKELNVPVVILSQLNRSTETRSDKRPMPSDLRDSGSIEQDADIIMFLYRDSYYDREADDQTEAECIVAKNRHGETGTVNLRWDGRFTRFYSVDREYE